MSLLSVIAYFKTGTYAVTRYDEGEWVSGRWVQGPSSLVVADLTFTADPLTDSISSTSHGLRTGDGPLRLTTTGVLPAGLLAGVDYWAIRVSDDILQLAISLADAMMMSPIGVPVSDAGSGIHTLSDVAGQTTRQNRSVFPAVCSVQPMSEEGTEDLPEGISTSDTRQLWTETKLNPPKKPQDRDGFGADRIEIDGEMFRVWKVGYYGILSSHYKCTVVREEAWA